MITGTELTLLGAIVPLTAIALLVAMALYLTRPGREAPAPAASIGGGGVRLPKMEAALVAASSIPILLALALVWWANISVAMTNLFIGVILAYHIGTSGLAIWHRLRATTTASPEKKDSVVLVCPFSKVEDPERSAPPTGEAVQSNAGRAQGRPQQIYPEDPNIRPFPKAPQPVVAQAGSDSAAAWPTEPRTTVQIYTLADEEVIEKDQTISVRVMTPRDLEAPSA